ncbi:hypothetical protein EJB05_42154, partial [Eragrostis curvula]
LSGDCGAQSPDRWLFKPRRGSPHRAPEAEGRERPGRVQRRAGGEKRRGGEEEREGKGREKRRGGEGGGRKGRKEKKVRKIGYNENGVDLSGFQSVCKGVPKPNEKTMTGIRNWLMKLFRLDQNQHGLNVMGTQYTSWTQATDVAGPSSYVSHMVPIDYEYAEEDERRHRRSPTPAFDFDSYFAPVQNEPNIVLDSQLSGAPPATQVSQGGYETPLPQGRPTRHVVPPEPLTYSADHVRAGRRAAKPGTLRGVAPKRGRI